MLMGSFLTKKGALNTSWITSHNSLAQGLIFHYKQVSTANFFATYKYMYSVCIKKLFQYRRVQVFKIFFKKAILTISHFCRKSFPQENFTSEKIKIKFLSKISTSLFQKTYHVQ